MSTDKSLRSGERALPLDLLETMTARLAATIDDLVALGRDLDKLPLQRRDWTSEGVPLKADLVEGPIAYVEAWLRYTAALRPSATVAIKRTAADFGEFPFEQVDLLAQQSGAGDIRMIIDDCDFDEPTRTALAHLGAHGLELRVMAHPPTTLFATSDGTTALPNTWGPVQPTSMLVLSSEPIALAVTSWFETLWPRAVPYRTEVARWEAVLSLLDQGLSDYEIAEALGWSTRTVRRRIGDAMTDLAVSNRFALGRAWATRGSQ